MSDSAHVATLGTGPLTASLWFAQLLIAFLFAAGFIHYYRQLWRFVCHWHSSKLGFLWVARILVAIVAIAIGTWLHMVGWRVFTNASGLMFHNMGLYVLTFILLDTHITWWEYGLRVLGVLDVWQMHHMGYFARPQFALSLAGAALGLWAIWHWREAIRYRTWPRIGAYLYLGVCFWTLLPPHSAGLTITPPIIIQALSMYLVMVVVTAVALGKEHRIDVQNATNAQLA